MRSRIIHPEFFKDEAIAMLEPSMRLAYIGLWCIADREGRFSWSAKRLKVDIAPYDDEDFDEILDKLYKLGFIRRYQTIDLDVYGYIPNFLKYQHIHHKEKASVLPDPSTAEAWRNEESSTDQAPPELPGNSGENPVTSTSSSTFTSTSIFTSGQQIIKWILTFLEEKDEAIGLNFLHKDQLQQIWDCGGTEDDVKMIYEECWDEDASGFLYNWKANLNNGGAIAKLARNFLMLRENAKQQREKRSTPVTSEKGSPVTASPFLPEFQDYLAEIGIRAQAKHDETKDRDFKAIAAMADLAKYPTQGFVQKCKSMPTPTCKALFHNWVIGQDISPAKLAEVS